MTFGLNFSLVVHIKKEWSPGGLCHLLSPTEHPGKCKDVRTQQIASKIKSTTGLPRKAPEEEASPIFIQENPWQFPYCYYYYWIELLLTKSSCLIYIKYISVGLLVWIPISSFSYHLLYGLSIFIFKALFYYQFNLLS